MKILTVWLAVLIAGGLNVQAQKITDIKRAQIPGSARMIYSAEIALPSQGIWQLSQKISGADQTQIYLVTPPDAARQFEGVRMARVRLEENISRGRYVVQHLHYPCQEYARKHDGVGPASIMDLEKQLAKSAERTMNSSPWHEEEHKHVKGPFYFMIPEVEFDFEGEKNRRRVPRSKRAVLSIELRPFVDDGKHWVAYTDGSCERVPIDRELIEKHQLSICPVISKEEALNKQKKVDTYAYQLLATCAQIPPDGLSVDLRNPATGRTLSVNWKLEADAAEHDTLLSEELKQARERVWLPYLLTQSSDVLRIWTSDAKASNAMRESWQQSGSRGRSTSAMNVLGGRAAMQETLQMQLIGAGTKRELCDIDIKTLEGVAVESHPFEKMLNGKEGAELALANVVPSDRFFVYIAKPSSILPMLEDGADFLSEFGGSLTGSSVKYYLKERYLARLGLDENWLRSFLACGAVQECALVAPDLFFIDGTEITVISRLNNMNLMLPLLRLAGVPGLNDGKVVELKSNSGQPVFWLLKKDLMVVSTSSTEAGKIAALIDAEGRGSLGRSAEFRYMLTKLPLSSRSRALAYFSDPFIRKLVSPPVKIAQLRRATEKSTLQFLTGKALLARLDGIESISLASLKKLGYLSADFDTAAYTLKPDFSAFSSEYGTMQRMATISEKPVTMISKKEAEAYKSYMRNYTRFWRQFFDPIAIRLNDTDDHSLEATTFILPLIDSSIYNGLREVVMSAEDGTPMKTPRFEQEPVLKLSLNLKEKNWEEITKGLYDFTTRYSGINAAILDDFGPAVHLAVHDADPVIAMGSGDILGAAGGNMQGFGRGGEMLAIPMILSMLTRPCTLAVATKNPQRTLRHLRMAASGYGAIMRRNRDFSACLYQIRGKDSWIYSLDIAGMLKIRLGLEVRDDFLFIQNIPWAKKSVVTGFEQSQLCGLRLAVYPEACRIELPGLHAAASEHQSAAAFAGAAMLYPLVASGYTDIAGAPEAHMKLFGYLPQHPAGGSWLWKGGDLSSSSYGRIDQREQPEHQKDDASFGLMQKIKALSVETQFEEDGLRTRMRWQMR